MPSSQPLLLTTPVAIDDVVTHPLLLAANAPKSAGGASAYLELLINCIEAAQQTGMSSALLDWLHETKALRKRLSELRNSRFTAPTALDMNVKVWGEVHKCIEVRRKAKGSTQPIDAILALGILNYAASKTTIGEAFIHGIRSLYRDSGRMQGHGDWQILNGPQLLGDSSLSKLLPALTNPPTRKFVTEVLNLLKTPAPSLIGANPVSSVVNDQPQEQITCSTGVNGSSQIEDNAEDMQAESAKEDAATEEGPFQNARREFERGDSILDWHSARAAFARRNDRLALPSWESLPPGMTCAVASKLATVLCAENSEEKPPAALALISLLTSTPLKVLLHAKLHPCDDFYIDLVEGAFCWNRTRLLRGTAEAKEEPGRIKTTSPDPDRIDRIPPPQILFAELRRLRLQREEAEYLSDLYDIHPGSPAWDALIKEVFLLLKKLSDPAFPAHLGRWSSSGSRVYLDVCASDLMAATCSLAIGLTSVSALHYFHPTQAQINQACADVYKRLGLDQPVPLEAAAADFLPADAELQAAFAEMEQNMQQCARTVGSNQLLGKRIAAFNNLTKLSAASTVFCLGGRGSKVEEFKAGDLYLSAKYLSIDDKTVSDGRGSRLLPKPDYLSHVLARQGHALALIATAIEKKMSRNCGDRWRELANGILRFEAIAFQSISDSEDQYTVHPIAAADVEAISSKYFGRHKNIMRHVLITAWSASRLDRNLLRLITGHAAEGLEMPALGAVYSPSSAILEAGSPLNFLLARWVPDLSSTSKINFSYRFAALPVRRILKNYNAHRRDALIGIAGPRLNKWNLAAEAIVEEIRHLLLNGQGPGDAGASLWLHLLVFDGLHAKADLTAIFENLGNAFELGSRGWAYSITRQAGTQPLCNPVLPPTTAVLQRHPDLLTRHQASNTVEIEEGVSEWLRSALPYSWPESNKASSPAHCMLACTALCCDLVLPSSLQYCYEASNQAAMLDNRSSRELLQLEPKYQADLSTQISCSTLAPQGGLDRLFKIINQLGDNKTRKGELKQRANLLDAEISKIGALPEGSWLEFMVHALQENSALIRKGSRERLEFSSLATYFSYLKPNLTELSPEFPGEYMAQDWMHASRTLRIVPRRGKGEIGPQKTAERQQAQDDATNWLIRSLISFGHNIPAEALERGASLELRPSSSTPIVLINDKHVDGVLDLLSRWHRDSPLRRLRANLVVHMLDGAPLRWGEASCTAAADLLTQDRFICIQPAGFSQIKSFMGRRVAAVSSTSHSLALELRDRLLIADKKVGKEIFFFLSETKNVVDGSTADWLHADLTASLRVISGNPAAKVHGLRARNICNSAFPDWDTHFDNWLSGSIGPVELRAYFCYNAGRAWQMELTRCSAGHAQTRTTLAYYLFAAFQLRAMALASTLETIRPTRILLEALDTTVHALKKQGTRNVLVRNDPWIFVQRHVPRKEVRRPKNGGEPTESLMPTPATSTSTTIHHGIADIQYVALRLAGCSKTHAEDVCEIGTEKTALLEKKFEREFDGLSELRQRVRGHSGGRAMKADIKLLVSDTRTAFVKLLERAGPESAHTLLELLTGSSHLAAWHERVLSIEKYFAKTPWVLECVSGIRFEDVTISQMLSNKTTLLVGPAQRDIGPQPQLYINAARAEDRNAVVKARLTTMARLLCKSYGLIFPPPPSH